ncbi:hypothetical protein HMSSN036_77070 [Paenibacillus macerans]|nr:hypothetical protein HMSSN036_77070 [Paenibacillus macerans]
MAASLDVIRRQYDGSLLLVLNISSWAAIVMYTLLFIVAGMFTYLMLQHLREADESVKMMREAATRDFLTRLYNSRAFEAMMAQKVASSNRNGAPFTLLFVDIDFFKQVNDSYGHSAGDAVLLQFADVLRDTFRPGDHIFARAAKSSSSWSTSATRSRSRRSANGCAKTWRRIRSSCREAGSLG